MMRRKFLGMSLAGKHVMMSNVTQKKQVKFVFKCPANNCNNDFVARNPYGLCDTHKQKFEIIQQSKSNEKCQNK